MTNIFIVSIVSNNISYIVRERHGVKDLHITRTLIFRDGFMLVFYIEIILYHVICIANRFKLLLQHNNCVSVKSTL